MTAANQMPSISPATPAQSESEAQRPPLSPEAELQAYETTRKAAVPLMAELTRHLSGPMMIEAARRLGMVSPAPQKDGRPLLTFQNEQEMAIMNDYAIFNCFERGQNAIARYLAAQPPPPDSLEMMLLEGMLRARYSLFAFAKRIGSVGVELFDLLRNERVHLTDKGFHSSGEEGMAFAMRVIPLPLFAISSGAALPVSALSLALMGRALSPLLGRNLQAGIRKLTPAKEADFVALIIRKLLAAGAAEHIRYESV